MADQRHSFLERQKELCLLSSFIEEQEGWLESWASTLGWTVQSLQQPVSASNPDPSLESILSTGDSSNVVQHDMNCFETVSLDMLQFYPMSSDGISSSRPVLI